MTVRILKDGTQVDDYTLCLYALTAFTLQRRGFTEEFNTLVRKVNDPSYVVPKALREPLKNCGIRPNGHIGPLTRKFFKLSWDQTEGAVKWVDPYRPQP